MQLDAFTQGRPRYIFDGEPWLLAEQIRAPVAGDTWTLCGAQALDLEREARLKGGVAEQLRFDDFHSDQVRGG